MDDDNKKPRDHKKSIFNRIENLNKLQKLNSQAKIEEKQTQNNRTRLIRGNSVYDKANRINSELTTCK